MGSGICSERAKSLLLKRRNESIAEMATSARRTGQEAFETTSRCLWAESMTEVMNAYLG